MVVRRSFYLFLVVALAAASACRARPEVSSGDVRGGPAPEQPASGKPYKTVEIDSTDAEVFGSRDLEEGMAAFAEKRKRFAEQQK